MSENFTYQPGDSVQGVARLCIILELFLVVQAVGTTEVHPNCTNQSGDHCAGSSSPLYRSGTALGCTCSSTVVHLYPRISPTSQGITVQELARLCIVLELFLVVQAVARFSALDCAGRYRL